MLVPGSQDDKVTYLLDAGGMRDVAWNDRCYQRYDTAIAAWLVDTVNAGKRDIGGRPATSAARLLVR